MTEGYFVASPGVLGLRCNTTHLKWSWGVNMPPATRADYERCAVRVRVAVGDVPRCRSTSGAGDLGKYHYFSGRPGDDCVYYERTLMGRHKLRLRIDGLLGDEPTLTVNPAYLRFVKYRFMNLHSAGYITTDIVALLLLRHGYAPMHCSGFRAGDSTVLVLAPPNTGKTLTSMQACISHGADFLAEDLAITDGRTLYAVPWTSTFRYYPEVESGRWSRLVNGLQQRIPPLELLPLSKARPVDTLVPAERILAEAPITHVVILERGAEDLATVDLATATRKAINLNRYEFNYIKAPALVAYEFFNPALDLDAAAAAERHQLRRVMENAHEVLIARAPDPHRYAPMILRHLASRS